MSQLIHLKQRIRSIKTTKKLTDAMRLISMSLYSKLDKKRLTLEHHQNSYKKLLDQLLQKKIKWKNKTFFPEDILNTTPLFIIISATKGFCGGLTNNLSRYIERSLFIEEHQTPTFLTIGQRATDLIEDKKFGPIVEQYHNLNSNNFPDIARNVTKIITNKIPSYSSVTIYSSFFKNFFSQKPQKNLILPFKKNRFGSETNQTILNDEFRLLEPIWEQDKTEIINFVAHQYLNTSITNIFYQSLICEYASRFVAMDSATNNAENYLETLSLQFNKLRQALITQEVSELSVNLQ